MTKHKVQVAGEDCTINVCPPEFAGPLWARWIDHVRRNEASIVGVDVETTAIDEILGPFKPDAKLRLVQFGSRRYAWVLDPAVPFWAEAIAEMLDSGIRMVSHSNYDPLWLHRTFGTPLDDRWLDTMPMAALIFPGHTARKGLKVLTSRFIDPILAISDTILDARFADLYYAQTIKFPKNFVPGTSACRVAGCNEVSHPESLCGRCDEHYRLRRVTKEIKAWGFTNIALDDPAFGRYAGLDAICVRRLLPELAKMLKTKDGRAAKLSRREQRIQRLATQMRVRGLRVDDTWTRELLAEVDAEYTGADQRLSELWGFKALSPKRGDWLLEHGAKFTEATPTGAPKLTMPSAADPGTLPELASRYKRHPELGPVFADMVTLSSHKNFRTNLNIILASARNDGFVHPEIVTQAAHTGRSSIKKPAMQTLKKRDPRLRGCFIAREGKVLVGADYKSQEIRIAAAYSRDDALLRIVRGDLNQHIETCKMIFGVDNKTKVRNPTSGQTFYDCAKTLDFAQQYGAGPKRIATQLDISQDEAFQMWLAWRDAYAGLVAWTEQLSKAEKIVNPWGREIPADPYRGYASGNYAVQSTGRDVLGDAIVRLEHHGWGGEFQWLWVHDELILEVDEGQAEDALQALKELMPTKIKDIELPVSAEIIGSRWGVIAEAA